MVGGVTSFMVIVVGIEYRNMGLCYYVVVSFAVNLFLQEEAVKKKYGGMLPKKPPLISKVISLSDLASSMLCCFISSIL